MSRTTKIYDLGGDADVESRWRALWHASPQRSPFSEAGYLRAAAAAGGLRVSVHLVRDGADDLAGVAVWWRRRGPYRELVMPAFTPFSPVLLRDEPSEADVHARQTPFEGLLESLESSYDVLRLHLPLGIDDVRPAAWRGWQSRPLYTYMLQLAPGAEPTHGWSSSAARNFRRHRDEFSLVEADSKTCADLCAESYERSGRPLPLPAGRLIPMIDRLRESGAAATYGTRSNASGRIEAAVAVLHDMQTAVYWVAGSLPGAAMTVLIGEMLPKLAADGIERFDFMGANTPPIAEFKRRFGCSLEQYYRLSLFTRRELKVLHAMKRLLR